MNFNPQSAELDSCLREVDLLRSMKHPNIVVYKDYFVKIDKGLVIIIMEFCECKFLV
jgi:serine/threonine protein kinase